MDHVQISSLTNSYPIAGAACTEAALYVLTQHTMKHIYLLNNIISISFGNSVLHYLPQQEQMFIINPPIIGLMGTIILFLFNMIKK
jgi:hypothetical protein